MGDMPVNPHLDRHEVARRLNQAVEWFNLNECSLLERDPSERSLTHRFAIYVERSFDGWDVDCEYNRDGFDAKILDLPVERDIASDETVARTVFPDIVVHRRGMPENLLVLEAKKVHTQGRGLDDRTKLKAFLTQLGYRYAATLTFRTRAASPALLIPEFVDQDADGSDEDGCL